LEARARARARAVARALLSQALNTSKTRLAVGQKWWFYPSKVDKPTPAKLHTRTSLAVSAG